MLTDPIADMIARIRNAHMRGKKEVLVPASRVKASILDALEREGYIGGYTEELLEDKPSHKNLRISLKYFNGSAVIKEMKRISKPSVQMYTSFRKMKSVANGLGNSILSTSKGVLSDREAKHLGVGGKILLTVR